MTCIQMVTHLRTYYCNLMHCDCQYTVRHYNPLCRLTVTLIMYCLSGRDNGMKVLNIAVITVKSDMFYRCISYIVITINNVVVKLLSTFPVILKHIFLPVDACIEFYNYPNKQWFITVSPPTCGLPWCQLQTVFSVQLRHFFGKTKIPCTYWLLL